MSYYVGALGLNTFNNEIEDEINTLETRIVSDINNTSNYVLATSNIFVKEIEHTSNYVKITSNIFVKEIEHTSNYVWTTKNIFVKEIDHTSNYVKITSNILEARIKALEGTEGSPGDLNLGIPAIPSTGGVAVAAAIATITAACIGANGITVLTLLDILEDKVDLNKTQADKIGGWSSNYTDKVGVLGSDYTDKVGKYGSNYSDKVGIFGSNYTDRVGKYGSNYSDKVGIFGSNYTDRVGIFGSNYTDKVGIYGSNYIDLVGKHTSNYTDKVGIFGSNYTDKVGIYGSNYIDLVGKHTSNYTDKVGIYGSNYTDKVGIYTSNYIDLVGKYTSNYTDKVGIYGSNYTDKLGIYGSNYTDKLVIFGSNYTDLAGKYTSNYTDKLVIYTSNYTDKLGIYGSNYSDKVGIYTSNYTDKLGIYTSNYTDKLGIYGSNYTERLTTTLGVRVDDTSNYVARIITELTTETPALGVRVDNTSNYVERINTELTTASTALGVRVDDTSNYVARIITELTTDTPALGVRVDNTSNYVERINTELTTASTALGVRVDNTSNYVSRINTELNTSDTELGVRVDNTSNYVATKQNTLTTNTLLSGFFNTTDFVNVNDKIRLNKSVEPIGYYQINIFPPGNLTWTSVFYNYSDRITPYNNNNIYYSDGEGSVPYKYTLTGGGIRKSRIYYNTGDKIMFKNWGNGIVDVNQYGNSHLYRLYKMRADLEDGWGAIGNEPTVPYTEPDTGYYRQFTWNGGLNQITDWRERSAWNAIYPNTTPSPATPSIGAYNDQLAYTLQSGWKYMLVRMVNGTFCDTPLIIHVNDPYYYPELSYIPPPTTLSALQPVRNKRSIPLSKQVGSYDPTPNTETTSSASLDYELTTGFNYDETSNLISVFDGNYNNLTNKPSLITTTDINHTSNYVSRINSDLTTAIGNKQNTLTSTSLATLLNTTTDFVINGSKIDLSKNTSNYVLRLDGHTSNYVARINTTLVAADSALGVRIDNTSNYVLRLDGHTSNYVARIAATSSASYWTLVPSTTNISYSAGNVGIGTSPTNKLHIYDDVNNETKLVIQNNTSIVAGTSPTEIVVVDAVSTTIGVSDRMIRFPYLATGATKDYSFTTTQNLLCDILVVGGGGGGGKFGGGGGGGAILFATNIKISNNSSVSIKVGNGGAGASVNDNGVNGINGVDSSITLSSLEYIAKGGGGGGTRNTPASGYAGVTGNAGGSGGGGSHGDNAPQGLGGASNKLTYPNFQSFGNSGGVGKLGAGGTPSHASGGGGGAGSVGANFATTGGNGGTGKEFITYFGSSVGHSGWFAGGGGGNTYAGAGSVGFGNGGNGLLGGGGNGGFDTGTEISATTGLVNTGGGGGGGKYDGTGNNGGAGGAGVVIIRYRVEPSTSSSLELVRGTTTDGAVDYSVGNYDGSFKIKSVDAGTPTDRLVISSAGNVDIAGSVNIPTGSTYKINGVDLSILTTTDINNTSNYVARINTELTTAIGTKQANIISTAGQLIIGNGNGATTTNAGLTWTTATSLLTATNIAISGTNTFSVAGTSQFTGAMGIGGSASGLYKLNVVGDINISSGSVYRINGTAITNTWLAGTPVNSIYYSTGNVGIGTVTIQTSYKLQVQGNSYVANTLVFNDDFVGSGGSYACNKISLYGGGNTPTTTSSYGFGIAGGTLEYFSGAIHRWYCGTTGGTGYGTERMTLIDNVLRIGQTAVGAFTNGSVLNCYGSDGSGLCAIFKHPNDSLGIAIAYDGFTALGSNTNADIFMRPRGTGMFIVNSSINSIASSGGFLTSLGAGSTSSTLAWTFVCAKFNGSVWSTNAFIASSDSRIKEDIQDINDDDALNKLLSIEPKTYKYVDKIAKGDGRVYGFIAQQVREVIPEAVKIEKSYIPNIMVIGDIVDYIITLPSQPEKVIIKVNDNIKCIDDNGNEVLVKVEEVIDEITFKIKAIDDMKPLEYTHDKIFIHGTEVEDFHTLSKEYIFTLNVCATQELHRRILSQEERIKELEAKMTDILKYLSL